MKRYLFHYSLLLMLFLSQRALSQVIVTGTVSEKSGGTLPGATVKVLKSDSSFVTGATTDMDGSFSIPVPGNSSYILLFQFLSYRDQYKTITAASGELPLGKIVLREAAQNLAEVEVKTTQIRGEQKGDTTQFNADAYKTNPDATAEDLVKKMPGVTSDNNGVKVNGETVQKILVDGKPFFGDDPNAAIKNLPAEIIDKVEVFDKLSDQAAFTGFNDGDQQKTINFVTKKNKNAGQFGKIYGGYGLDEKLNSRYNAGATINSFNNKRRLTLLLLSNNINQQNFSMSDITGAMGTSGQNGNRGGGGGGGGNNPANNLLAASQNGITTTQSAGLNYSDSWGKKINVSGSYFFNYSDNKNLSNISRNYFTADKQVYQSTTNTETKNQNQRFNFRFEYQIDSANKLTVTPNLSFQNNTNTSTLVATNTQNRGDILLNNSNTTTGSDINNLGYDFSNNLLFQHKFAKKGRTISLNVNTQLSERHNNGSYTSLSSYYNALDTLDPFDTTSINQRFNTYGYTKKIGGSLSYTEPLTRNAQLQFNYSPSYSIGKSDKRTNDLDPLTSQYTDFDVALSNKYDNTYLTQKGGLSYKYQKDKMNLSLGADAQVAQFQGEQTYPTAFTFNNKPFKNVLPNAMLNYRFSKSKNLRVYYRSGTNIPSLSQLQNVLDISNPLQVKTGNASLKQTFENNLNIRFGGFNAAAARNAMVFVSANYTDNYISNGTYILQSDSVIQNYLVRAGSQLSKPVNLNGYYTARAFFVYGFPFKAIKSNLNFNGGMSYGHTPSIVNGLLNYSNSYAYSGGIFIGSNISDKLDFSVGYTGNYTQVKNSIQKQSDNSYFNHSATLKFNWIFYKGFVLNTDVTQTLYNGLTQSFNQSYALWNAYIGYKFLKNNALEAKISVFDILNQNRSIGRNITGNYTEDYYTTVLRRYGMVTLTYTLRNFKGGATPPAEEKDLHPGMPPGGPPPGMRPGGGSGGGTNNGGF